MKKIEYQAPEMEIVKMKVQSMLCLSDGTGQQFNDEPADPGTFIPD